MKVHLAVIVLLAPALALAAPAKASRAKKQDTQARKQAKAKASSEAKASETKPAEPKPAAEPVLVAAAQAPAPSTATAPKPSAALTAVAAESIAEKDENKPKKPWSVSAELDHSLGQGTFVDPSKYAFFGGSLGLSGSYSFELRGIKLSASVSESFSWEYTLPDNSTGRRANWSDLRLGLSAPSLLKEQRTEITLTPSLSASVPLTPQSWQATTITVLSASASLSRKFGKLNASYSLSGSKGFHVSPINYSPVQRFADPSTGVTLAGCIARPDEPGCYNGANTNFSINNTLSASYSPIEKLSFRASLGYGRSWRYQIVTPETCEEYSSKAVDSNGNPVVHCGMGNSDSMTGTIGVSYSATDAFSVSAGMATSGAPLTDDHKALRFPFYDFLGPAANRTSFSVSVSASL